MGKKPETYHSTDRKIQRIAEILNVISNKNTGKKIERELEFNDNQHGGSYKISTILTEGWIIKIFKPSRFQIFEPGFPNVGSHQWAEQLRNRIEKHSLFLSDFFGNLLENSKSIIGKAKVNKTDPHTIWVVYKIQKDRSLEIQKMDGSLYQTESGEKIRWDSLIKDPTHKDLKEDMCKLYFAWKHIREYGLSLDINPANNMAFIYDEKTANLRLKIFDFFPLFLTDKAKFDKSEIKGVPRDLITLDPRYGQSAHLNSEKFFLELQEIFDYSRT